MKTCQKTSLLFAAASSLLLLPAMVNAQPWTYTIGSGNGLSWDTVANWTPVGSAPASSLPDGVDNTIASVTPNGGRTDTLDGNHTIGNIAYVVNANRSYTWNPGTPSTSVLTLQTDTGTAPAVSVKAGQTAGNLYMNAPLAGTQGFTMTGGSGAYGGGNGAFQLGAANTITGPVTVNSGWLVVNAAGSLPVGAPVTVSGNNAVLAGTGTVNDTVTLTTGYIYPGSAAITSPGVNLTPGTLTVGNLTWNGGSINETLGTASSLLSVNNALTMGSASTYNFNITQGAGFSSGNTYDLLNFNSESGVTSSSFTVTGVPAGMEVVTEWTVADQSGEMILVPEPSTLALLVGGVAGLWQMRRRKA